MKKIFRLLIAFLSKSRMVYIFGRKVVDYHDNLNNCELETNGELDFLRRNIEHFDVIFDVGANVGEWSQLVNELRPAAKVHAFEPVGGTYRLLSERNFNSNTKLYRIALGNKDDEVDFYIDTEDSTLNSVHNRGGDGGVKEKVVMNTIDNFCSAHGISKIDFLKIDVEGYEMAVLEGAKKMIADHAIGVIQFEYGGTYIDARVFLKDVFDYLQKDQYEIYKIYTDKIVKIPKYDNKLENFQYANYLAVAPGVKVN